MRNNKSKLAVKDKRYNVCFAGVQVCFVFVRLCGLFFVFPTNSAYEILSCTLYLQTSRDMIHFFYSGKLQVKRKLDTFSYVVPHSIQSSSLSLYCGGF